VLFNLLTPSSGYSQIIPICDKLIITLNYLVAEFFHRYQQYYKRLVILL